ncbi:hypothetical protein SRABI112_04182 [Pseudomonas mediterranea]|nr:hypothetical protein SRABI112_04182 [Pseudomonas mediterranea]
MKAIRALPSTEVSTSGRTMQRVAAQERKVIMHMVATQMYTRIRMVSSDSLITSLVAASMPALPAARMNSRPSRLFSLANVCTAFTARSRVSALWSLRNTSTGAREQLLLYRPSARAMELFSTSGLRDRVSHLRLPSFMPLIICLDTVTREIADCTPSVFCIFHISSSMGAMAS